MARKEIEYVEIDDVTCTGSSARAIRIQHHVGTATREVWVPQSQVHDNSEVSGEGDTGTLIIPRWLAVEKGLLDE